jgi:hypothetical protein
MEYIMKTTLDIQDELLARAKSQAAREHSSLTALIEDGLRLRLRKSRRPVSSGSARLPVYRGKGGLISGIDPTSNRSLFEAADGDA